MTNGRTTYGRAANLLRTGVSWAGQAGTLLLLVNVLADASLRFAFNRPIAGSIEYVSYWWMVTIVYLGLSMAERHDEHIDAPIVFDRLPEPLRREFQIVSRLLFLSVLVALVWWGWHEAAYQQSFGARGGAAGVSTWPGRYLLPIGAAACAVEVLARIADVVRTRPTRSHNISQENLSS